MTVDGCSGGVNTFIVEPFVAHEAEYYLCIQSSRLGDDISFSDAGPICSAKMQFVAVDADALLVL